jgi:hypothetical protein
MADSIRDTAVKKMRHFLGRFVCVAMALSLVGCGQMVPIDSVNRSGTVDPTLTMDQVREAIEDGAQNAGWVTKEQGPGQLIASYQIRRHNVVVMINYSEDTYSIDYKSSREMKVQCTDQDYKGSKNIIITGRQSCPGYEDPKYIHGNYQKWITRLKGSIDHAIAYAD